MTRPASADRSPSRHGRANCLAISIALAAVAILYLDFNPLPAGADTRLAVAPILDEPPVLMEAIAADAEITAVDPDAAPQSVAELLEGAPETLRGSKAVALEIALLEAGAERLQRHQDYSANFSKQECHNGTLGDDQVMAMKVRHAPFSVYMKWITGDKGREVLYVDGENDGKMLVHAGGWKARLLPVLRLDPRGSLALSEARHPITDAGLLSLTKKLLDHRRADLKRAGGVRCQMMNGHTFASRDCYCFVVEYDDPSVSEIYRKSIVLIDKELSLPVCIRNFGWPLGKAPVSTAALDESTLIEYYRYTDIRFDQQLADADFDHTNSAYTFRH